MVKLPNGTYCCEDCEKKMGHRYLATQMKKLVTRSERVIKKYKGKL